MNISKLPQVSHILYDENGEGPEEGEAETSDELVETLHRITETTMKDWAHATRSGHEKGQGWLSAGRQVQEGLQ